MCYQTFQFYLCGHNSLDEGDCEEIQDQPFGAKFLCSSLQIQRLYHDYACGIGAFYCGETADGAFLNKVYRARAIEHERLCQCHLDLQRLHQAISTPPTTSNQDQAIYRNDIVLSRVQYEAQARAYSLLFKERNRLAEQMRARNIIIHQAIKHYEAYPVGNDKDVERLRPAFTPAVPLISQLVYSGQVPSTAISIPSGIISPEQSGDRPLGQNDCEKTQFQEKTPKSMTKRTPRRGKNSSASSAAVKRGSPSKRKSKAKDNQATFVRRSTRFVRKDINYAESSSSSLGQATPSHKPDEIDMVAPETSPQPSLSGIRKRNENGEAKEPETALPAAACSTPPGGKSQEDLQTSPVLEQNMSGISFPTQLPGSRRSYAARALDMSESMNASLPSPPTLRPTRPAADGNIQIQQPHLTLGQTRDFSQQAQLAPTLEYSQLQTGAWSDQYSGPISQDDVFSGGSNTGPILADQEVYGHYVAIENTNPSDADHIPFYQQTFRPILPAPLRHQPAMYADGDRIENPY